MFIIHIVCTEAIGYFKRRCSFTICIRYHPPTHRTSSFSFYIPANDLGSGREPGQYDRLRRVAAHLPPQHQRHLGQRALLLLQASRGKGYGGRLQFNNNLMCLTKFALHCILLFLLQFLIFDGSNKGYIIEDDCMEILYARYGG